MVLTVFGQNLRQLTAQRGSISGVAAELDIARVQYQRFLKSEAFPKPQVLSRICTYFGVDARILIEPLATIQQSGSGTLAEKRQTSLTAVAAMDPDLAQAFALCMLGGDYSVSQAELADGLYRYWAADGTHPDSYYCIPCQVTTRGGMRLFRAYHGRWLFTGPRSPEMRRRREFRGTLLKVPDGFIILFFHAAPFSRITMTHLRGDAMLQEGGYIGFSAYARPEMAGFARAARCYLEKVPPRVSEILACARLKPHYTGAGLPSLIHDHLRLPFA